MLGLSVAVISQKAEEWDHCSPVFYFTLKLIEEKNQPAIWYCEVGVLWGFSLRLGFVNHHLPSTRQVPLELEEIRSNDYHLNCPKNSKTFIMEVTLGRSRPRVPSSWWKGIQCGWDEIAWKILITQTAHQGFVQAHTRSAVQTLLPCWALSSCLIILWGMLLLLGLEWSCPYSPSPRGSSSSDRP